MDGVMLRYVARWLGVALLAAHGCAAAWFAKGVLSLPIESGGLLFGPFVGVPLIGICVYLLAGAVLLAVDGAPRQVPYLALACVLVADLYLLAGMAA